MKKYILLGAGIAIAVSGAVFAQTRTAEDAEALQREIEEKALRVPARRDDAQKARAAQKRPPTVATARQRTANWDAVRADLRRTSDEDTQRLNRQQTAVTNIQSRIAPPPGIRALAADRLAATDQNEVDRVTIPLLLPAHPDVRDKMKVYGLESAYTATAEIDAAASLSISGTCNRVVGGDPNVVQFRKRLAEGPPRLPGTGAAYHISRNDFGADLSFSKFGCGYVMTVECGNPAQDPRCSGDDYITMLADSMILANPERAGGE